MKKSLKLQVFFLALAFFVLAPVCHAQTSRNLDLQLNRDKKLRHSSIPRKGEFKLSLGSQMFTADDAQNGNNQPGPLTTAFSDLSEDNSHDRDISFSGSGLKLRSSRNMTRKISGPVITLNNSYENNAIGFNDSASSGLAIAGENGRLRVYGEFEQQHSAQIPINETSVVNPGAIRASTQGTIPAQEQSDPHDRNAALSSRYYLEAIYSFKPTLKGKVSFKRSMIDTFESEEKLQVEGIVEATRNVLIKAGYNNEVRPEVTEPKSNKDTKVWTEFILKF